MQNPDIQNADSLNEISLADIVNFLADSWKKLVIAGIFGAFLGFAVWFFVPNYHARLPLTNNEGLSVLTVKSLQQTLPNLAAEIVEKDLAPQSQLALYKKMSDPEWWKKAIIPIFSLTKADIKDLGAELEKGSNGILYLVIDGAGSSKDVAIQNARNTSQFIRKGGIYLSIKAMLASQQADLTSAQAQITSKMNAAQVELEYQRSRLRSLEALAKRFPNESRSTAQVIDPKDSGAKYLPISTQIIAINTDISNNEESIARLMDRQAQLGALKEWLEGATPLFNVGYDGLQLNQDLLALESRLRSQVKSDDPKAFAFVDGLRNSLLANETRFKYGLEESGTISVKKPGMIKFTALGLAAAFLLALMVLVGQRTLKGIQVGVAK